MSKFLSSIIALALLAIGATSCFSDNERVPAIGSVAVIFPEELPGEQGAMISHLQTLNFDVYAARAKDTDGELQSQQIKQMQDWGVQYIVLASVDTYSTKINEALTAYVAAGGKVICYDRLQQNSDCISAYVSSSYDTVGQMQIEAFKLLPHGSTIEMVSGPAFDVSSLAMFAAANEKISPNLSFGAWVCPSGRVTYEQTKAKNWTKDAAYEYMKELLKAYYSPQLMPDAILAASDAQAAGVVQALEEVYPKLTKYPIITGMGYTESALIRIVKNRQTMTVFRDLNKFILESSGVLIKMINKTVIITDKRVNNGAIDVPFVEVGGLKAIYKKDLLKQ